MNTLKLLKREKNELIQLTASSELMENQFPATTVDPQHIMKTVEDMQGNPMIFSIGNNKVFYVILRDDKSKTGWKQIDLSSSLDPNMEATAFEVVQARDGRLLLALALAPKGAYKPSKLYLTPFITNSTTLTDWTKVHKQWVGRSSQQELQITKIIISADYDPSSQTAPLGIVATLKGDIAEYYHINTDVNDTTWLWSKYELPENAVKTERNQGIVDLAVGRVHGDQGIYALYETATGLTLEFTTLPDSIYHKTTKYNFVLPADITSIIALPGESDSFDLYAAGDGIYMYANSGNKVKTIASKNDISDIHQLIVKQDQENVAVFAIQGDEKLYTAGGLKQNIGNWAPPLPIFNGVTQIAALRNTYKITNELFIVKGDRTLSYLNQDPESTLWKENKIEFPSLNEIVHFKSFTTHISIQDGDSNPLPEQKVNITASSWTYVTINGRSHSLDSKNPVSIYSDIQGNITIIQRTETMSSPVFHIQSDKIAEVVDINPNTTIKQRLELYKSGDDLRNAKLKDGSNLLNQNLDQKTLDSAAMAIQQLTKLSDTLPQDGSVDKETLRQIASKRAISAFSRNVIHTQTLEDNYRWGLKFDHPGCQYFSNYGVAANVASDWSLNIQKMDVTDFSDAILLGVGDALEWLENGLEHVEGFLLQKAGDVIEFFVEVGKKVFKFVIDTLETTFRIINWVLKETLGIDLEKIIQWLGFVFDWEDIKDVHKVLVNLMNQSLNYGKFEIEEAKDKVNGFFNRLKIEAAKLEPYEAGNTTVFQTNDHYKSDNSSPHSDWFDTVTKSPGGNWGQYHLLHSGTIDEMKNDTTDPSDPLSAFMKDIVWPELESLKATAEQLSQDFVDLFGSKTLTPNQVIEKIMADAVIGLIDAVQKIVTGIMKFIEDVISYIQANLNQTVDIPFFSSFYKWLSGDELSILDAVMLILAIPTTIAYKLITGKVPFADERQFETAGFKEIFEELSEKHPNTVRLENKIEPRAALEADGEENQTAKHYSHIGGIAYILSSFVSDGLALWAIKVDINARDSTNNEQKEKLEKKALNIETIWTAIMLAKNAASFPVGNESQVSLQRGVWGIHIAAPIFEFAMVTAMRSVPLATIASKAKGIWSIVEGLTVIIMEGFISKEEFKNNAGDSEEEKFKRKDAGEKLGQNICYFVYKLGKGGFALAPDPTSEIVSGGVAIASLLFANGLNAYRLITNITYDEVHHNF